VTKAVVDALNTASLKQDVSLNDVQLLSSSPLETDRSQYHTVSFAVTVVPESFGYDSKYDEKTGSIYLKDGLQEYLNRVVDSGIFYTELQSISSTEGVSEVFEELEGIHIKMSSFTAKTNSKQSENTKLTSISIIMLGVIICTLLVVLIALKSKFLKQSTNDCDNELNNIDQSASNTMIGQEGSSRRIFTKPAVPTDSFPANSRIGSTFVKRNELASLHI